MSLVIPLSTIHFKDYSLILYSNNSIKKHFKNTGLTITLEESMPPRDRDSAIIRFQNIIDNNENDNNALFKEDEEKIDDSIIYHSMGSYQIGEIARLSALLYDRGVDVIKELEKLHHKFNINNG